MTKKQGTPVHLVNSQSDGEVALAKQVVDLQGLYTFSTKKLANKLELTMPKLVAVIDHLGLKGDQKYFKEFKFGKSTHKRYTKEAEKQIRQLLAIKSIDDIWTEYQARKKKRKS